MPSLATLHRLAFFGALPDMPVLHTAEEDIAFYCTKLFPNHEIWLTEQSGFATGFIAFRPGWVDQLYVHPEHQGRGIGRTLLALAQSLNPHLRLWTFQANLPARRFYEHMGFVVERETDGEANEERQPDVLYSWTPGS